MTNFRMKYEITPRYLSGPSMRRPAVPLRGVRFMVAHDTGNPGSTAANNVAFYERTRNDDYASAQIFVDDRDIIECIPFLTAGPERAYHVVYNTPIDNALFGVDANDWSGGVELCYGGNINLREAYARYVWVMAYACWRFGLNPASDITSHYVLDPLRKIDPKSAFGLLGITFEDFLSDVRREYDECTAPDVPLLDEGVRYTVSETWIKPAIEAAADVADGGAYIGYLRWLDAMLTAGTRSPLDKGVAITVINTWLSPSWFEETAAGRHGDAAYIHWLADCLRISAGLDV